MGVVLDLKHAGRAFYQPPLSEGSLKATASGDGVYCTLFIFFRCNIKKRL